MEAVDWDHPFWSKVCPEALSGCWLWMGHSVANRNGTHYGYASANGRTVRAHRHAVVLSGRAMPTGMWALHKCDVPLCVNPDHLFVGTPSDNVQDCLRKGRHRVPSGEQAVRARLTAVQVREIRASSLPHRQLARVYGIDRNAIRGIRRRDTWKTIE